MFHLVHYTRTARNQVPELLNSPQLVEELLFKKHRQYVETTGLIELINLMKSLEHASTSRVCILVNVNI
jgi:hypothetical protein